MNTFKRGVIATATVLQWMLGIVAVIAVSYIAAAFLHFMGMLTFAFLLWLTGYEGDMTVNEVELWGILTAAIWIILAMIIGYGNKWKEES